ncbi:MAG: hypothetical protein HYZ79_05075 [Candidatus Melainabacteria bacterium]|nr:hypothetical protein [Candidatus Melainabacteria bacterium]
MKPVTIFFIALFTFSILFVYPLTSHSQDPPSGTSLYQRLGGVNAVAAVIDDFIERLLTNEVVTKNEDVLASLQRITKPGLKFQVTAFVCEATGGPEKYSGRSMKDSHAHLNISEAEWQASVQELKNSLAKFSVPENEQNELIAIVATTKSDIVTAKEALPQPVPQAGAPTPTDVAKPDATTLPPIPEVQVVPKEQPTEDFPLPSIDTVQEALPLPTPEDIEAFPVPDELVPKSQAAPPAEPDTEEAQVAPPPEPPGKDVGANIEVHVTPPAVAVPTPQNDASAYDELYQFDAVEEQE